MIGGSGKTQTALRFHVHIMQKYTFRVFFFNATPNAALVTACERYHDLQELEITSDNVWK